MIDLISRQAAIDAVDGVDWYHQNKNGEMVHGANDNDHQAWYKAEDIYKAVESVPSAQRWIPVTEQLPEKSSPWRTGYLATVTSDTWSEPSVMYVEWETTTVRGKEVSRWIWNNKLFPKCWDLVAWMPLPEPWKGEEHGTSRAVLSQKPVR